MWGDDGPPPGHLGPGDPFFDAVIRCVHRVKYDHRKTLLPANLFADQRDFEFCLASIDISAARRQNHSSKSNGSSCFDMNSLANLSAEFTDESLLLFMTRGVSWTRPSARREFMERLNCVSQKTSILLHYLEKMLNRLGKASLYQMKGLLVVLTVVYRFAWNLAPSCGYPHRDVSSYG